MRKAQDLAILRSVAAEVKALRAGLQISQEELAHRADVHRSYIARLETATTQPTLLVFFSLAQALEVDPEKLIGSISRRIRRERRSAER